MSDDDELLTELVTESLQDNPQSAQQWIAIALANIADTLEDILMALERPKVKRARSKR